MHLVSRLLRQLLLVGLAVALFASAACGRGDDGDAVRPMPVQPADPDDIPDFSELDVPDPGGDLEVTDPIPGTSVAVFDARDDTALVGRVFGQGRPKGVVLAHPSDADMRYWYPLAQRLMEAGYSVLPFDLRGYGQSEGEPDPAGYPADVNGAADFLASLGTTQIVVIGAEAGGTAAVAAAGSVGGRIRALATVGSGPVFDSLDVRQDARRVEVATLVISTGDDDAADLASIIRGATLERREGASRDEIDDELFEFVRSTV